MKHQRGEVSLWRHIGAASRGGQKRSQLCREARDQRGSKLTDLSGARCKARRDGRGVFFLAGPLGPSRQRAVAIDTGTLGAPAGQLQRDPCPDQ